jgi:ABC-2 type transport system permease protein
VRKVWIIAAREYLAAVRTKSFLISLVFMPILMVSSVTVQVLVDELSAPVSLRFAVVDRTGRQEIVPALQTAVEKFGTADASALQTRLRRKPALTIESVAPSDPSSEAVYEQRYELSERVLQGDLAGFLEIGPDVYAISTDDDKPTDRTAVRYQSNSPLHDAFARWAERIVSETVVARRCADAGLPRQRVEALLHPVPLQPRGLTRRDETTGALQDSSDLTQAVAVLVPVGLTTLMFMVIMVGATPLMQGVVEEKMQRVAEVLLGSVRPFWLMLGKLLGMLGVSLTLAATYLIGAYWLAWRLGFTEYLPLQVIVWFSIYQVLAVLMYGSLFIAIGAACTDMKETQMLMLPVVLLICLPMFTLRNVIQDPNGTYATAISLFPLATPLLMVARMAVPPGIAWWQPPIGVVGVLLVTTACIYAAGRIFRVGILMQGKGANLADLVRWVIRG